MTRADVVVVGGGVVGCAIAWALAREQLSVLLLERDAIGAHASRVAAGMLTPLSDVRGDEPAFPLGAESLAALPGVIAELRERSGIDPGFVRSGVLRVARTPAAAEALRRRAARLAEQGAVWLEAQALATRAPHVAGDARGALWSPDEGHVGAELLTLAYARAAEALGARFEIGEPVRALVREGRRVTGVRTASGVRSAPWVVLATGPWGGAELGIDLPVAPVRGQLLVLRPVHPLPGAITWDERIYLVPRPDGRLLAGATSERVGFDRRVTAAALARLASDAIALVPALADAGLEGARAGLRPGTPDGLPIVGPAPALEGLVLACGHHRHGVLLSAITARLVADAIVGKGWPDAAAAFSPARFASD